jgi:PleD family two-component response regulator
MIGKARSRRGISNTEIRVSFDLGSIQDFRILVLDDHENDAIEVKRSLTESGYTCRVQFFPITLQEFYIYLCIDVELCPRDLLHQRLSETSYQLVFINLTQQENVNLISEIREKHQDLCIISKIKIFSLDSSTKFKFRFVFVAVVSDICDSPVIFDCLDKGADDFILKPVRTATVRNLWSNVWRKKRERLVLCLLETEQQESTEKDKKLANLVCTSFDFH